jgi:hypothetical protein
MVHTRLHVATVTCKHRSHFGAKALVPEYRKSVLSVCRHETACFASSSADNCFLSQVLLNGSKEMPVIGIVIVIEGGRGGA